MYAECSRHEPGHVHIGVKTKDRHLNKMKTVDWVKVETKDEMTNKFAIMLRSSYSCTQAGVAFVNSCPAITNATSKKRMATSLFSEWVADVCTIHGEFGYKIKIVSMGANSDKSISDAINSCGRMSSAVTLTK